MSRYRSPFYNVEFVNFVPVCSGMATTCAAFGLVCTETPLGADKERVRP